VLKLDALMVNPRLTVESGVVIPLSGMINTLAEIICDGSYQEAVAF